MLGWTFLGRLPCATFLSEITPILQVSKHVHHPHHQSLKPHPTGQISKALVLQCDSVLYSGCKPKFSNYAKGEVNAEYMTGPYVVGASFASENILYLLWLRMELGITASMLTDVPPVEIGPNGEKICPWQKVWLDGLRSLRDREVYVMSTDLFKTKFDNHARYADHEENMRRDSFDAGQDLPDGERALSIMDWERRQLLIVAAENNLTIVHLEGDYTKTETAWPIWYPTGN